MARVRHVSDSDNGHGEEGMVVVHQVTGHLPQSARTPGPPVPPWESTHPQHDAMKERPW
jgi:hypothetical protein